MDLIKRIKEYMFENDVRQNELAKELSIQPAYLSKILTGKQQPSERLLWKIDKYLDCHTGI
jgi:transcriptional regulator with XRE-family HTH domain